MARTRKVTTDAPAPVDFAAVAKSAKETVPTSGGGRFANNPFVDVLRESFEADNDGENGWREVTVNGYHAWDITAALRAATQTLADDGIGSRVRYAYKKNDGTAVEHGAWKRVQEDGAEDEREVTIKFLGRPRKEYATGENGNGSDVDGGDDDPQF